MKGEIYYKTEPIADGTASQTTTGFDSILFLVTKTGTTTVAVQDSDDGTTFAAADAKYVIDGTEAAAGIYKLAYIGYKKYVKVVLGTAANGSVVGIKYNKVHQG